jgi:glutamate 5-kinase
MTRELLSDAKRIVVKIGSSLLDEGGRETLRPLVEQLESLHDEGREIVLVTSGAIHFGTESLNRDTPPVTLPQKQATAAVGQPILMSFYKELFDEYGLKTAQVLLTQDGIHNHDTYLNACNTMNELLDEGIVPIVNENDTVATEEIQFGNNDTLASLVTTMVDGDVLIILSDVAGLYPDEPSPDLDPISRVDTIDEDIEAMARPSDKNSTTVGGMVTKIEAARTLTRAGTAMVIADGRREHVLRDLLSGKELGTLFTPDQDTEALQGRKRWIGYHLPVKGIIIVDSGAAEALKNRGTSLLPSGVTEVSGQFERGDAVSVRDESQEEFGRGLVNYNREQVHRLRGCQTDEISDILGHHDFDEIIHRDNLVIFNND